MSISLNFREPELFIRKSDKERIGLRPRNLISGNDF